MYAPSMPAFWRVFIKKNLNFVKGYLCIYSKNHMVFIFHFVNVYPIDLFVTIEEALNIWNKVPLVMMYDPFTMLLDSVC